MTQVFFALLLAHLLGDYPFQTGRMVAGKTAGKWGPLVAHVATHAVLAVLALALFTRVPLLAAPTLAGLGLLVIGHALADLGKSALVRNLPRLDGASLYLADQALHVVIVAAAAQIVAPAPDAYREAWAAWMVHGDRVLLIGVVLLATVYPTGYLIRYLLQPLSHQLEPSQVDPGADGLRNAGLYLGYLERLLLAVAVALGSVTAIGVIIGAKAVARFPEFRSRAFAEYFLVGTLLSTAFAVAGGLVLRVVADG